MILADVNVLIHAFRSDSADHDLCRGWLHEVVNGDSRYGMSPQVLSGVMRVTTHPKVFSRPSGFVEVNVAERVDAVSTLCSSSAWRLMTIPRP